jgi:siroheme synthase-like protein
MSTGDGVPHFAVSLLVTGRPCLVVGGGPVAGRKIATLLGCGAAVTVVAPEVHEAMAVLSASGAMAAIDESPLDVQIRPYRRGEAAAYRLVITATGDPAVDGAVHDDAEEAGVWVNSADDSDNCTFILPAVRRDGPVSVAVSTGGTSPALSSWLAQQVSSTVLVGAGDLAVMLGQARARLVASGVATDAVAWHALLDGPLPGLVADGRLDEARALVTSAIDEVIGPSAAV